ncbi:hypothetical protein ACHAXT_006881 [Thalassiosira profunda]
MNEKRQARAAVFDALHQEMELAEYATGPSGQKVKKVPKNQQSERSAKRRALELADKEEMAIEADGEVVDGDGGRRKRLRGRTAAFGDDVLKSMPAIETTEAGQREKDEMLQDVAALGIELGPDGADRMGEYEEGDDDDENESDADEGEKAATQAGQGDLRLSKTGLMKPTKRVMHRLKDFSSQRLARMHGEAMGAHIRGMSETAVQKLRELAKLAPGAPQVYSSLGMVYESMLRDVEEGKASDGDAADTTPLSRLQHRLDLAQKTYASYHVAAILCKRDFVLWERSGDAAAKAVKIYSEIMSQQSSGRVIDVGVVNSSRYDTAEKQQSEHKLWLDHALTAYQSADNLRPPGVDIPCKLAQTHMELGNYMEALSILTDLRKMASGKSAGGAGGRSEMEASYPCWLLYADLMMKIGYECQQFQDEKSTAHSVTFKRWLTKNAKEFDWKERRLQALCLALEAAAGSKSCFKLIKWMRERATKHPCNEINVEDETASGTDSTEAGADSIKYEKEREKMLNLHKVELRSFDRMTKEMNPIEGSHVFNDRVASRKVLVEKHRAAVKELAMQHGQGQTAQSSGVDSEANEANPSPLPLQGSFAAVYDIASLLLRQCVQLRLFDGGLLAVESVTNYSKERVAQQEKKANAWTRNDAQNPEQGVFQSSFKYDKINFASDSDDSDSVFLSDEEELEEPGALQTVAARLPEGIQSLQAICLLGAGGNDYVALQHVERIILSNEADLFEQEDTESTPGIAYDPLWVAFAKYYNAPLNKSFLLASISDVITENEKGFSQPQVLLEIFREHVFPLIDGNEGKKMDEYLSSANAVQMAQAMKILLASMKLLVDKGSKADEDVVADTAYALKIMTRFQQSLWKPQASDCSLPQASIDMLSILSDAMSTLVQSASSVEAESLLDSLAKSRLLISKICHAGHASSLPPKNPTVESLQSFPLPCSWQTSLHKKLSLTAYNLCVACCVSSFSGWEPAEFNLDQLGHSEINFFGVSFEGSSAAGFLPGSVVSMIAEQWDLLHTLLPNTEGLRYEALLNERSQTGWYQKAMKTMGSRGIDPSKIPIYGEENAIRALLLYSMLCLVAAKECEGGEKDEFVKLSMSILLPMTQFSVDKQVWDSSIGTEVLTGKNETKVDYYLDGDHQWLGPRKSTKETKVVARKKPQQRPRPNKPAKPASRRTRHNIARVPASTLLEEWKRDDDIFAERPPASDEAQTAMKRVDDAMKNLRKSRTLNSLERASIDVSVALIALVTLDECDDPFACLQQASIYAEMGSKRGTHDEAFKRFLPLKKRCTPLDALDILGRADCLRAVHFLQEAQYLCNWVAEACHDRRDPRKNDMPWNSRWRVVGIQAYIVGATIDETRDALSNQNAVSDWGVEAADEMKRGKSDAHSLMKMDAPLLEEPDAMELEDPIEQGESDAMNHHIADTLGELHVPGIEPDEEILVVGV